MNEIKNCKWECSEERDGDCSMAHVFGGKCDCEKCECFFSCIDCKKSNIDCGFVDED